MSGSVEVTNPEAGGSAIPTIPGTPFGGGFFAGLIVIGGLTYALVVAPKDCGESLSIQWKIAGSATVGTSSINDGFSNSEAMNTPDHPAAKFCCDLRIGGFDDWYLPSRDELEMCYRNLKPGTDRNHVYGNRIKNFGSNGYNGVDEHGNGHNASSDPIGKAYTKDDPKQTVVEAFQKGGPEAFERAWYW